MDIVENCLIELFHSSLIVCYVATKIPNALECIHIIFAFCVLINFYLKLNYRSILGVKHVKYNFFIFF